MKSTFFSSVRKKTIFFGVLSGLSISLSYGQTPKDANDLSDAENQRFLDKNPGVAADSVPEAAKGTVQTPARKDRIQKSKLTRDESESRADKRKLTLNVGEDKVVDLDFAMDADVNKVLTANAKYVAIRPVTVGGEIRQLVFTPIAKGETTVYIRDGVSGDVKLLLDLTITADNNLLRRAAELRELFKDIEGIEIKVLGQKVVLDGDVLVAQDYGRIVSVIAVSPYSDVVLSLVGLSPLSLNALAKEIKRQITAFAPNVTTRVSNGMIFLEGSVDDGTQAIRAEALAKLYLPEARPGNATANNDKGAIVVQGGRKLIQNFILVNPPPPKKTDKLIRVTVHYVELQKDYAKSFGFSWNPTFGSSGPSVAFGQQENGQVGSSGGTFSATIGNLLPKLNSANQAGFARVLKQATVIVKSGEQAELNDNVTTPTTTLSAQGVPVPGAAIVVGLKVQLTPQIIGQSDDIQINIFAGNNATVGTQGGTTNRTVKTVLYVRSRESAAIGGIDAGTNSTDFNRAPSGSTEGSSIFNLNRKKEVLKNKSQFVLFVTPEILDNASDGSADLRKNFRIKLK